MARLPTPGGDNGNWGTILNDYLSVAHNGDGSLKDIAQTKVSGLTTSYAKVLTPEAFGAIGDGAADDSAALAAMTVAITAGAVVRPNPTATYRYTIALTISDKSNFIWQGGSFVFAGSASSINGNVAALSFINCSDYVLQDANINITTQNQQYNGVYLTNSTRGTVKNCKIYNARWSGISVYDGTADTSVDNEINGNVVRRCRFGLVSNSSRCRIINNVATSEWTQTQEYIDVAGVWDSSSLYWDGIIIGGTGWSILNNTFNDNGQSGIYGGGGCHDGTIEGNTITGNHNKGIDLGAVGIKSPANRLHHITIIGNNITDNATGNIHGRHIDDSVVSGNLSQVTNAGLAGSPLIVLNGDCDRNVIIGNVCNTASSATGIFIDNTAGAADNVVMWNLVTGSSRLSVSATANIVADVADASSGPTFTSSLKVGTAISFAATTGEIIAQRALFAGIGGAGYMQLTEQSAAPSAPISDRVRLYAEDNGSNKTRLMARFPTGASVVIATEP